MDTEKEIRRIISKFIIKRPVLGAICLRMKYEAKPIPKKKIRIAEGIEVETYNPFAITPATNTISYDPQQIEEMQLKSSDIEFALAHEAMHILTATLLRLGNRDIDLWNIASDLEVNYLLKDMGISLPPEVIYVEEFHNEYYYAEKIYEILLNEAQGRAKGNKKYRVTEGERSLVGYLPDEYQGKQLDQHNYPEGEQELIQAKCNTQNALSTASQIERNLEALRGAGTLPASVRRLIDNLLTPKITWKDYVMDVTTQIVRNNYSFRRCNPYYRMQNIYVPTLNSPEVKIIVIVDTSGSIGNDEMRTFISELVPLIEMYNVTFISCDADIYVDDIVEDVGGIEDILKHIKGGGGTVFAPAFKWIEDNVMDNCVVILMTDGYNTDERIEIPFTVEKTIVLTTGEEPSGFTPDVVIPVSLD